MRQLKALICAILLPIVLGQEGQRYSQEEIQRKTLNKWYNEFDDITKGFDPKIVHEFVESKGISLPNVEHKNNKFDLKHFKSQPKQVQFFEPSTEKPTPTVVAADPVVDTPQEYQPEEEKEEKVEAPSEEEEEEDRVRRRQNALRLLKKMIHLPHLLLGHSLRNSVKDESEGSDEHESDFKLSDEDSFSRGWPDQEKSEEQEKEENSKLHGALMPFAMVISISSSVDDKKDSQHQDKNNQDEKPFSPFSDFSSSQQSEQSESSPYGHFMSAILSGTKAAFEDEDCGCEEIENDQEKKDEEQQADGKSNAEPAEQPKSDEPVYDEWLGHEVEEDVPKRQFQPQGPPQSPFMMSMRMHQSHLPFFAPRFPEKSWSLDPSDKFYMGRLPQDSLGHRHHMWLP